MADAKRLGSRQILVLKALAQGPTTDVGRSRPWQLSSPEFRNVLESLTRRGLATRNDTKGTMRIEMRVGAVSVFHPEYTITDAGRHALNRSV